MGTYIKLFDKHNNYNSYINSADALFPNVSYCMDNQDLHYNSNITDDDLINKELHLFFDDFPSDYADDEYDGDMDAFKQNAVDNYESGNEYVYNGDTFEFNGNTYYLWEHIQQSNNEDSVAYLLTDELDFRGKSLADDLNNNYCPFIYILDYDMEEHYNNINKSEYILIYFYVND